MLSLLSVLALAALVLVPPPPVPFLVPYPHLYGVVENSAHPLIFALVALIVLGKARPWCARRGRAPWMAYAAAVGTAFILGSTTELAQLFEDRDCSLEDLVNDVLGASFAAAAHAWACRRGDRAQAGRRRGLLAVAVLCAIWIGMPLLWAGAAYLHRQIELPRLWRADSLLDRYFSQDNGTEFPGTSLDEPWPDWRGYRALAVTVRNATPAAVGVVLRVHDRQHDFTSADRYNQQFELLPDSEQTLQVPLSVIEHAPRGRLLNLAQVTGVILFRLPEDAEAQVTLEELRLIR